MSRLLGAHEQSDGDRSLRGGGNDGVTDETHTIDMDVDPIAQGVEEDMESGSEAFLPVYTLSDYEEPLSRTPISGSIDGVPHIAAWTNGNGACGLHALFGVPVDGELFASGARERIFSALPADIQLYLPGAREQERSAVQEVCQQFWKDAFLAAQKLTQGEALENELLHIWTQLPEAIQTPLLTQANRQAEEKEEDKRLTDGLLVLAKSFFQPDIERTVIRPLCVQLDYLNPSALLEEDMQTLTLARHQGSTGSLQILHPAPQNALLTKYQALFETSGDHDNIKVAFFRDPAWQHQQRRWFFDQLSLAAQQIAPARPEVQSTLQQIASVMHQLFRDHVEPVSVLYGQPQLSSF